MRCPPPASYPGRIAPEGRTVGSAGASPRPGAGSRAQGRSKQNPRLLDPLGPPLRTPHGFSPSDSPRRGSPRTPGIIMEDRQSDLSYVGSWNSGFLACQSADGTSFLASRHSPMAVANSMHISDQGFGSPALGLRPGAIHLGQKGCAVDRLRPGLEPPEPRSARGFCYDRTMGWEGHLDQDGQDPDRPQDGRLPLIEDQDRANP